MKLMVESDLLRSQVFCISNQSMERYRGGGGVFNAKSSGPTLGARCRGSLTQPHGSATDEEKDYQDMICLGRKGGQSLKGEGP